MTDGAAADRADRVDLWFIATDQPPAVRRRLHRLLDPVERERAATGPDTVQRDRFTVVRGAVRLLAAARLGIPPDRLTWQYGRHGKPAPVTADHRLQLNWSASGALAALAIADGRPVGVDVEEVGDPRIGSRVARRHFPAPDAAEVASAATPAERADRFTRLWCRREACVKVHGGRLAQGLGLTLAGPAPLELADPGPLGPGPLRIEDVPVPGPFHAAVAAVGGRPFEVVRHHWTA